ncbi:MAG: NmrA family protein [Myxococcales bacterium]|nr:NmrA family protein [Myxococcales bacterium]
MTKRIYVITSASGRIAGAVASGLLRAGHEVRAIARDPEKLRTLAAQGATVITGNLTDRALLEHAFTGADAALLLISGDRASRDFRRYFADVGAGYAAAARATRLPSALFVSSLGAHSERHRGLVLIHRDVELALDDVPTLATTHLRAPFFYENLFYFTHAMKTRGGLFTPLEPDVAIDMGATRDVAALALRLLAEPAARRTVHELHGVRPLALREIAGVIAAQLGRAFPADRTSRGDHIELLVQAGASYDFAHLMNDAWDTFSTVGLMRDPAAHAATNATTRIDDFVREHVLPKLA